MAHATSWDPQSYAKNARFVSDLGEPLLGLLDPKAGELILDLGCGDGALTVKIASAGCNVLGIDSSLAQLEAARQRGVKAVVMDGQQLAVKRRFDAVFTNAALHWMNQPDKVVVGVANALIAGGRFVGEFGGEGNIEAIRQALHRALRKRGIDPWSIDPWYFPSTGEYTQLLDRHGLAVAHIELIPRPTALPGDIIDWLNIFAQPFLAAVRDDERPDFVNEVRSQLIHTLQKSNASWYVDYVRLRFKATK